MWMPLVEEKPGLEVWPPLWTYQARGGINTWIFWVRVERTANGVRVRPAIWSYKRWAWDGGVFEYKNGPTILPMSAAEAGSTTIAAVSSLLSMKCLLSFVYSSVPGRPCQSRQSPLTSRILVWAYQVGGKRSPGRGSVWVLQWRMYSQAWTCLWYWYVGGCGNGHRLCGFIVRSDHAIEWILTNKCGARSSRLLMERVGWGLGQG